MSSGVYLYSDLGWQGSCVHIPLGHTLGMTALPPVRSLRLGPYTVVSLRGSNSWTSQLSNPSPDMFSVQDLGWVWTSILSTVTVASTPIG